MTGIARNTADHEYNAIAGRHHEKVLKLRLGIERASHAEKERSGTSNICSDYRSASDDCRVMSSDDHMGNASAAPLSSGCVPTLSPE